MDKKGIYWFKAVGSPGWGGGASASSCSGQMGSIFLNNEAQKIWAVRRQVLLYRVVGGAVPKVSAGDLDERVN